MRPQIILALAISAILAAAGQSPALTAPTADFPHPYLLHNSKTTITLYLATADTPQKRRVGLSGIHRLPANAGMRFIFASPQKPCFWMKNTHIPLVVAFFTPTGKLTQTEIMRPHTTTHHCAKSATTQAIETHPQIFRHLPKQTTNLTPAPAATTRRR